MQASRARRRIVIASLFALVGTAALSVAAVASAPSPSKAGAKPQAASDQSKSAGDSAEAKVDLKLIGSGATQKLGGYIPQQVKLTEKKPAAVKKAPELKAPLYGEIKFAGKSYPLALDEPKEGDAKLYVDANANGDLTDDPEATWASDSYTAQDGTALTKWGGSLKLPLKAGESEEPVSFSAYRFDKKDPNRAQLKNSFFYYPDYAFEGEVTLAGATYHALLTDEHATGTFGRGGKKAAGGAAAGHLLIDVNGDGKFTPRGEMFEPGKPFNIKGTTWALADDASGDAPVKIAKSNVKVAEIALPPNHSVGQKITPFTAKRTDGKTVNFPADYKGKVVMLDFWATWCPPCMAEVDGLVAAYNEYHPKGVEILGISLDQAGAAAKLKSVTKEKGMTWPQVYDGKYWKAAVAEKYGIQSIPAAFLVDGDTGEILAAGGSLRGGNLPETLKKAVENKGEGATAGATTAKAGTKEQAKEEEAKSEPAAAAAAPEADKSAEKEKPAEEEKPPF